MKTWITFQISTKRIQPARGWCATVQIVSTYPASPTFPPPLHLKHPHLSNSPRHSSPPAPTLTPHTHSLHSRPNTTYTSRISPHIPITQTSIRRPPLTAPTPAPHIPTPTHSHTRYKQKTSKTKHKEIKILQLNANGIRSTVEELKHLMITTQPDVVAIQGSKLTPASRTPQIPHYTAIRTDREHKQGGGLITSIKSDTTFTHTSRRHKPSTRTTQKYNF